MAFQIVTGQLASQKAKRLLDNFMSIKQKDAQAKLYYIVPEHIKFDAEEYVLSYLQDYHQSEQAAMLDIQVLSFKRLLWYLDQDKKYQQKSITDTGLTMILRQVVRQQADHLQVFRRQIDRQGFLDKLLQQFKELYEAQVTATDLLLARLDHDNSLIQNQEEREIQELSDLYQSFLEEISRLQLDDYVIYQQLEEILTKKGAEGFKDTYLIMDQHYHLNARESHLLAQFARYCQKVWLTLPLSHQEALSQQYNPVINLPRASYRSIKDLILSLNIEVLPDWDINETNLDTLPSIMQVGASFKDIQLMQTNGYQPKLSQDHHFFQAFASQEAELMAVTNEIRKLVMKQGYRYSDILVLARNLDKYRTLAPLYFSLNEIPLFFDHAETMAKHSLVDFFESLLNLKAYHFKDRDLLYILKSQYFKLDLTSLSIKTDAEYENGVNQLENILIANGYFSYRMSQESFQWHFTNQDQKMVDPYGVATDISLGELAELGRQSINRQLVEPLKRWSQETLTGGDAVTWFYQFLEILKIKESLIELRDEAIEEGQLAASRHYEQVWDSLMALLEEFYTIFKNEKISFDLFKDLLVQGLKKSSFNIIPPTLDQVRFTNIESPQIRQAKICFVLDLNQDQLPLIQVQESFLNRQQRQAMNDKMLVYQHLSLLEDDAYHREFFLAYQLLFRASDHFYFAYHQDVNKENQTWSPFISQLMKTHQFKEGWPPLDSSSGRALVYSSPAIQKMDFLEGVTRLDTKSQQGQAHAQDLRQSLGRLLNWDRQNGLIWGAIKDLVLRAKANQSLPDQIKAETAVALYGNPLVASVSRLESYFQDPYSHFLQYGLRLKERDQFLMDPMVAGNYYHEILDRTLSQLIEEEIHLKDLSPDQLQILLDHQLQAFNEIEANQIFQASAANRALQQLMQADISQVLLNHLAVARLTDNQPLHTELIFGPGRRQDFKGLAYPLGHNQEIRLTGKIDRIDTLSRKGQDYLSVIDYKSGNKEFKLQNLYYGLDLQIVTYLSVALANYPNSQALGAFYQSLGRKFESKKIDLSLLDNPNQAQNPLESHRFSGFISQDSEKLREIEVSLEPGQASQVYPVQVKKDGNYSANSSYFDEETMKLVLTYNQALIQEAGRKILAGNIHLSPFKELSHTPSLTYPYRLLSAFDATEHFARYRHMKVSNKEALGAIQLDLEAMLKEEKHDKDSN